jgi:hypothetical protein
VRRSPFGSPTSPQRALEAVGERLSEWYRAEPFAIGGRLELRAADDELPDVTLSLERDRRLFSRTLQLAVEASAIGSGPAADAALALRTRTFLRRYRFDWREPVGAGAGGVIEGFLGAGLERGVSTMTNVRELTLRWSQDERRWRLRLVTLAGALIGTSPGAAIAIPLEAEDVDGLLTILRALVRGARGA